MPAPTRSRPQQQRAREMRRRLLDTARQLVERRGVEPLTTQTIADAAHVSIGTVYRYFPDRAAIIVELVEEATRDISFQLVRTVGQAIDLEVDQAASLLVDTLTTVYEQHAPILLAAMTSSAFDLPPYLNHTAMAEVERSLLPLASVIPSRSRPDLSPAELDDLVFVTMGVTSSACLRIALQRPATADRDAMIRVTATMLAAALKAPADT
ncbi:TetR/AcrR family transcriptional regulator [Mycobacterium sp. UM_Kg1]|uniref:TetR/AcrR family transcriptional regulator n=1 Tax=Mycobacterium sp. UM_Kg1 TaxID=1545691 RepID=UPI002570289B|nr:TetR/AcrR family transcriptional regulator [Mycobacterium sp. UM_Kg1]